MKKKTHVLRKGFINNAKGVELDDYTKSKIDDLKCGKYFRFTKEEAEEEIENITFSSLKKHGAINVQIEDWSDTLSSHSYASTVGAYPISVCDIQQSPGRCYPAKGKSFRCAMDFPNSMMAKEAFEELVAGTKTLFDFREYLENKEYAACLEKEEVLV